MKGTSWIQAAGIGLLLSACQEEGPALPTEGSVSAVDTAADAGIDDEQVDPNAPSCAAVGGAPPQTIEEVTERLNALPAPASLPCFVASLPRPLKVVATNSRFSVQPADGPNSPRIFILTDG